MTRTPAVGLLYPGHAAEDDYPALEQRLHEETPEGEHPPLRLPLVHTTIGVDEHTPEALLETGSHARLAEGAGRLLAEQEPYGGVDSVMWACTSGSFVYGWEGAAEQAAQLQEVTGRPTSSTSIAFAQAVQALGVRRVAVAASYPADLAEHFERFLAAAGADVVRFSSHGIFTAGEVGLMGREQVVEMVRAVDVPEAEAMLVPDTAMHSLLWIEELEEAVGKPVLTANLVTIWEGLRIAGTPVPQLPRLGSLFSAGQLV